MNGLLQTTRANFSFSDRRRRNRPPKPLPRRQSFLLEALESRLLLSADLVGVPTWIDQGPEPILNAGSTILPNNPATGAVQSVAVNPTPGSQQIYVGSVNGGIWRTNNADPNNTGAVTWTPLTDQQASLAVSSIAFSPLDNTGNTIYAGTGSFSNLTDNGAPAGGPAIGILRTTDGGATWQNFAVNPGNEGRIKAVLPTGIDLDLGPGVQEIILVAEIGAVNPAVGGGLFRSNDNGQNFTPLGGANGLPAGPVSQLIVDPNNNQRFYAALPGQGVFQGTFSAGVITWVPVNTGIAAANINSSANIQIAAQNNAGATTLFVALADAPPAGTITGALTDVLTSTDNGANWTTIGTPAGFNAWSIGGSGMNLIADPDPTHPGVVYIGGLGGANNVFRFDPAGPNWVLIVGAGAQGGTAPHADSRDMAFIGNNILVETDDGGIFFIQTPTDAANHQWQSFIGETATGQALGGVEFHDIAWDSNSNIIIGGSQDNSTEIQLTTSNPVWRSIFDGDGGDVLVDNFTLAGANQSIRYFSSQNLSNFSRQVFDSNNNPVGGQVGLNTGGLAGFVAQFITPIEINAIAPPSGQSTRIVIGGGGTSPVYESNDAGTAATPTWTAVAVPASGTTIGTVTALAYGGRLNGVDNADVLYVGDNNGNVFVRSTAGGTLTATATPFPGGNVRDITLDPNDWRHAFVAGPSGVWETTNNGGTWIPRTGNLASFTSNLQTIEFAELGDVDAVLVGGLGGVFRMITNNPGVWTEFGAGLPNTVAYDLDYNAADDVLVVGTFGQGAWTVGNASDFLTVPGVLQIFGDEDFIGEADTIRLVRDAANPSLLDVFINGDMSQFQLSTLQQINVFGLGGDDTLIVDSSNGLINVGSGIHYDGDGGVDGLQLLQTGGPTIKSDTYSVGPAIGSGVSTIVGEGTAGTQTVFFEDLSPVLDLVPAPLLTVNATPADNAISYSVGSVLTNAKVTIDEHEPIEFANKTALTINAGAGQDTISVNNPNTPTGLTGGITIIGGDPSGGDTLNVTGVGGAVPVIVNTATATISGATGAGGAVPISYGGIEHLNLLAGIGNLTLTTTGADDTVVVTPGLTTGANSGTVQSSGAVPQITFVNSGDLTANLGLGNDALLVNGSSSADTITVDGAKVAITTRGTVNYTGVEALTVNGNAASDTFNVTPSTTVAMFIDGGDPVGQLPGDQLNISAGGAAVTFNAGPGADEGSFVVGGNQPVSFDHIESIGTITGGTSAVINGTNGPDAVTVIARDGTYDTGADGMQDFTVSVNGGPALLFVDVPTLTINAGSGNDVVTLSTPAPNNAVWDVDVTVNGGTPATDTDQLIVQTPGVGAESVVYTPTASDGGTLDLQSLSSPLDSLVTINGIDVLSYDGQGDNDSLTIVGTTGADTIVHTPGSTDQAGSFQVNSLLALGYQNLGSNAIMTVDGNDPPMTSITDTLVYNGTAANDTFTIGGTDIGTVDDVKLNSRLVLNTTGVEVLTLEGFAGDDTFTLVPAISASVYSTINLNGGGQASVTGDRVFLVGTTGGDNIFISGQVVSLGGVTINGSGVEDIRLDALGGDDLVTYTGVSGVTENITVSSSGVAGGGQLSVPGVTLVDFSGVERIDVIGNTTEADTLTFAGTNAADRFEIDLAAAGTDAEPILQLWNGSTTPLLTLRNYTNFDTLNVQGLGGEDTFNVYTRDTISRNLFVDGGTPSGKKKATDNLNIFYTPPRPTITQSAATQDPDAGIVTLQYDTARFVVQYDDIEQVPPPKRL